MTLDELKDFVNWWNVTFPFDRWWRLKHKVALFSEEHKKQSPIDIRLEYEEDRVFRQLNREDKKYTPGMGNWLNKQSLVMSQEEIDSTFENLDLSKFNDDNIVIK